MYGADELPWMLDQLLFSMRMRKMVWSAPPLEPPLLDPLELPLLDPLELPLLEPLLLPLELPPLEPLLEPLPEPLLPLLEPLLDPLELPLPPPEPLPLPPPLVPPPLEPHPAGANAMAMADRARRGRTFLRMAGELSRRRGPRASAPSRLSP
jgi:hypothetical protein